MTHYHWLSTVVGVVATGCVVAGCGVGPGRAAPSVSPAQAHGPVAAWLPASYPPFAGRVYACPPTRRTLDSHRWHLDVAVCWYGHLHGAPVSIFGNELGNPVWVWTQGGRSRIYRTGYPPAIYQFSTNDVCLGSFEADWAMAVNLETGQLINPLDGPPRARQWRAACAPTKDAHAVVAGVPGSGR